MSIESRELDSSFLDSAADRAMQIERALGHVARAVELELADIALMNGNLDEETKAKISKLGEHLVKISRGSDYLLGGIARTTGVVLESSAPYLRDTEPTPPLPVHEPEPLLDEPEPLEKPVQQDSVTGEDVRKKETVSDVSLYERIVDIERFPSMKLREGHSPVEIIVTGNTNLKVGDRDIQLDSHERYLFNALMLLRDKPRSAKEIREFGFFPGAKDSTANQAFSKSMGNLAEQLNMSAGVEVIKKLGQARSTRYAVNPDAVLTDLRTDEERDKIVLDVKKN